MRIVSHRGAPGGVEREFAVVQVEGQTLVYFSPAEATKVQLRGPHFVAAPSVPYGLVQSNVDTLRNLFSEFVCSDFADGEELKTLRVEYDRLKASQISEQETKDLRADRAELAFYREEERERAKLKARLAMLDTPRDQRGKGA